MSYLTDQEIVLEPQGVAHPEGDDGAEARFLGKVRKLEREEPVDYLEYEAYRPMAESLIDQLVDKAKNRWALTDVWVQHRLGKIPVGQVAVAIVTRAPHRKEAFEACQFLIDSIKHDVPIWKRAHGVSGEWIESEDGCGVKPEKISQTN